MATVVMTGGTSGFGVLAAERMRASHEVLLGARAISGAPHGDGLLPMDLASLPSVRQFADEVTRELDGAPIDALVLNAGIVRADADGRTRDGVETTFAVNHLAHHLLLRLLLPHLAKGARVTLTTSGTHDPDAGTELVPPRHADADLLAHPERDPGWTVGSRAVAEVLVTEGATTVPAVARHLDLARQNVQRHVDELVRLGHARTRDNPAHRRSALVDLTPRGATEFRRLRASELAAMDSLAPECGVEEVRRATEVLAALERDIRERAAGVRA